MAILVERRLKLHPLDLNRDHGARDGVFITKVFEAGKVEKITNLRPLRHPSKTHIFVFLMGVFEERFFGTFLGPFFFWGLLLGWILAKQRSAFFGKLSPRPRTPMFLTVVGSWLFVATKSIAVPQKTRLVVGNNPSKKRLPIPFQKTSCRLPMTSMTSWMTGWPGGRMEFQK